MGANAGVARRLLLAAAIAGGAYPAAAQQPSAAQTNAIRQACRADYQAHCSGVPTGGSAALSCLQQNSTSLSQPCQSALSGMGTGGGTQTQNAPPAGAPPMTAPPEHMSPRQEAMLLRRSCGADYRAFCSDVEPGGGRALACLKAHGPSLSHQCRSALLAARQPR